MNNAFITVFAIIGLLALGGILFAGAYHQLFIVGVCVIMILSSINDKRRDRK